MSQPATNPANKAREQKPLPPRYAVVVICVDEAEQKRIYEAMRSAGHSCRVVTTVGT